MSQCFYLRREWFDLLWSHGWPVSGGDLVSWPLGCSGGLGLALPMVLRGGVLQSLSSYYTPRFGPYDASEKGAGAIDLHACASWLKQRSDVHTISMQPLGGRDAWWAPEVEAALRRAGFACWRFQCGVNWSEPLVPGSNFATYWAARPSRLKNTVQRAQRKLVKRGGSSIAIVSQPGALLQDAIAAYQSVYAASWKGAEPCPQFMPGLLELAASQGVLRLGLLRLDGEVVAAQVWLVHDGQADIYKLAQRPGLDTFSVGSVLSAALMAHVIDHDKVAVVDFLLGDDAYKRDWMSIRQPLHGMVAFRWRDPRCWPALGRHVAGLAWAGVRRWLKRRDAARPQTTSAASAR